MKHFFNAKYDVVFKSSVIGNINVLKKILESALDITIDEIIVKNNEEIKDYIKEKNKIRDCYCICGKRKINIEVNSKNYNGLRKRNFAYLAYQYSSSLREGQDYKDMKEEYIQLNLTWGIKSKRVCNQYEMASIYDKEDKWIDNLKIIEYNMDRLKEEAKAKKKENKYLSMLTIEEEKELIEYCEGDKVMEEYQKKVSDMNEKSEYEIYPYMSEEQDKELVNRIYYANGINDGKAEGIKEGKAEGIKESALNMLKENIDIKVISKVTGLDEEEILLLKE